MITMGNLTFDPEVARIIGPGMLNGIAYMFTWGTGYNFGTVLGNLAQTFGSS